MKKSTSRALWIAVLSMGLAGAAPASDRGIASDFPVPSASTDAADPSSETILPELPEAVRERLRDLSDKDPAAFRDLLRHSLAARLLRATRGEDRKPDSPVELAETMMPGR